MKKVIYALLLPLVVAGGLVFANHEIKNGSSEQATMKPAAVAKKESISARWEDTPDGIRYTKWTLSPEGKKVLDGAAKIKNHVSASANMEAVVTSLSLPSGSRLGFGVMVRIDGVDYILKFDPEQSQLAPLRSLEVDDKIIVRSHVISHAPKYAYPIITGEYVERDGKIFFKRAPRIGGC